MKKAMQNCCSVILTAALALVGVSASAGEKLTLSAEEFMQIGQNLTYLDGLPIVEKERAAVVWINPGSTFAGLNYDGTEVDPENNMVVAVGTIMEFAEVSAEGQLAGLACELPEGIRASDCDWVLLDTRGLVVNSYNQDLEKSYDTYMMSDEVIGALKEYPEILFSLLTGVDYSHDEITADMIAFALGLTPDRLDSFLGNEFLVAASHALHGTKWIQASGIRPLNITGPNPIDANSPNVVYGWYLVSAPMPYVDLNLPAMKDTSLITEVLEDFFGDFPEGGYLETAYDFSAFNAVGREAVLQMKEDGYSMHCSMAEAEAAFSSWPAEIQQSVGQPILDGFDYLRWHADFVVTFDRDVKAHSIALAGQFNNDWTGNNWLAFPTPNDIKANEGLRLLGGGADFTIKYNYNMIMFDVGRFRCGAANTSKDNIGTTMRVELRLYRPSIDMTEILGNPLKECSNGEDETGEYITVGEYSYTFQTVDVAGDPDERPLIANVNGQNYLSLQEAINAAANGDVVTVLRTPSEASVSVPAGKSVKLDAGFNLALCSVEGEGKWTMSGFPYMGVEADVTTALKLGADATWNFSVSSSEAEMSAIFKFIESGMADFTRDELEQFNSAYNTFGFLASLGAELELVVKSGTGLDADTVALLANDDFDNGYFELFDGVEAGGELVLSRGSYAEFVLGMPELLLSVLDLDMKANAGKTLTIEARLVVPCEGMSLSMPIGSASYAFGADESASLNIVMNSEEEGRTIYVIPPEDLVDEVVETLGDDASSEQVIQAVMKKMAETDVETGLKNWEKAALVTDAADGAVIVESASAKKEDQNRKTFTKKDLYFAQIGFAKIEIREGHKDVVANAEKLAEKLGADIVQKDEDATSVRVDCAKLEQGLYQPTVIVPDNNGEPVEIPDYNAEPIVVMTPTLSKENEVETLITEGGEPVKAVTTIIPVPGVKDSANNLKVSEVVDVSTLKEGDTVMLYNKGRGNYESWSYVAESKSWESVSVNGESQSSNDPELEPGQAIWFSRESVANDEKIVIVAQQPSAILPSKIDRGDWNLVANPTLEELNLNDSNNVKGVAEGDQIIVPTKGLGQKTYTRKDGNWGYYKTSVMQKKIGGKDVNVLVNKWQNGATVGAGEGFWYVPGAGGAGEDTVIKWNKK